MFVLRNRIILKTKGDAVDAPPFLMFNRSVLLYPCPKTGSFGHRLP